MARCPACCRHFSVPEDEPDNAFCCPYCLHEDEEDEEDA